MNDTQEICSICQYTIDTPDRVYILSKNESINNDIVNALKTPKNIIRTECCRTFFHSECLKDAFMTKEKCPNCRFEYAKIRTRYLDVDEETDRQIRINSGDFDSQNFAFINMMNPQFLNQLRNNIGMFFISFRNVTETDTETELRRASNIQLSILLSSLNILNSGTYIIY